MLFILAFQDIEPTLLKLAVFWCAAAYEFVKFWMVFTLMCALILYGVDHMVARMITKNKNRKGD